MVLLWRSPTRRTSPCTAPSSPSPGSAARSASPPRPRGSHGADANLSTAANFLLFHAPALIGLSLYRGNRLAGIAGWVLVAGVALFAGDLVMRSRLGMPLFPFAAPLGGGAMILGWLLVAGAALSSEGDRR